ncbi:bifunctional UDP-N-acetylglucosamine diphosphorylase/glucosamine-1-phosphate N-acetyltransferase GlmU [Phenylobacterium sp. J367]|uniref:bifunctional UDP-N-acetylglucosamine diphosphorylase/glucosamine-1-phosphate N-acetyltransferase GlmU n=1 Tax=Phenylobacterium sp. J367 TaxID=2898435 RepID=UPI002150B545|nr:bifunctional UDP-N-acetylglucosamine diphosphorylase/glucosamine-1-phosphate N-acetyltransferase GlmU [Phenylobacterium sp. J367]MCR5879881.1 bifunctional UDP-N-acetylglucosamine diphosphorylase/glucosamine-1-phosphate N-acetyltransferase GlmU [Phenylobacterium sp. J367]
MTARAAVILAAGQGTRMKSPIPKVLHKVGGRSHLDRMIDTVQAAGCERVVVVVGTHSPPVRELVEKRLGAAAVAVQTEPLGTAHAVLAAKDALADFDGDVLITYADAPLLSAGDLEPLFALREQGVDLAMLAFEPVDPLLYGRVIKGADGHVIRIVEARDATPEEKAVKSCNAGMMCADRARLFGWLEKVGNQNVKGEYYLTDIVGIAVHEQALVRAHTAPEAAVMGCDTPAQLAQAEGIFQQRQRQRFLDEGVTLLAPETVHFSWDTEIAPGAVIEQFVVFGVGVKVAEGAVIRAFSHLEGAVVGEGALIGPYARLRPGADIGRNAHIGNFVEVKKVKVGEGAKANHLSYLGDGSVGAGANIGAGTIFCNYDGFFKYETHVGEGAFIGSNTALVAPVTVGAGGMTGSGSVITQDVPPDALALERGGQTNRPGWAAEFRARKSAEKAKAKT